MRKFLQFLGFLVVLAGIWAGGYFWFQHYRTPVVREHAEAPLYTVGSATKAAALRDGKTVREWGPLPGSLFYPGGLAFRSPAEAQEWLTASGKALKNWRVFQLTGDFQLDTHVVRGLAYTNKTLLISHEIPGEQH